MKLTHRKVNGSGARAPGLLVALGIPAIEVTRAGRARTGTYSGHRHLFSRLSESQMWDLAEKARAKFVERLRSVHPDKGGGHDEAVELNRIWGKLKRIFLKHGVAMCVLLSSSSIAQSVLLQWDANPTSDEVQAYYVHQSSNVAGPYLIVTNSATNIARVQLTNQGRYFWYVTASNFWGVSGQSNTTNTPTVASNVTTLRLQR